MQDSALATLSCAIYLSLNHLVALTVRFIIMHLRGLDVPAAVESAAQLHVFASEHGLEGLSKFCAAFLAVHIKAARRAPAYAHLSSKELDEVCNCNLLVELRILCWTYLLNFQLDTHLGHN